MRKLPFVIATILAVILFAAILVTTMGHRQDADPIEPSMSTTPTASPETLPPTGGDVQFYSDYNTLWSIIETEYPFLTVAGRVTGKDFVSIKNEYRAKLIDVNTTEQFYSDIIVPCLNEFAYTGHLTTITPEFYKQSYRNLQRQMENDDITTYGLMNWEQMNTPAAREFYGPLLADSLSSGAATQCGVYLSFPESDSISTNLELDLFPSYSTAYISIKSMMSFGENNDDSVLESFFAWIEENNYENCIIDIQENSGGSDGYWMLNLVRPNLKGPLSYQYYALMKGERSRQYVEAYNIPVYPISELPLGQFPNINKQDIEDASHYATSTVTTDNMGRRSDDPYEPLFSGKFWLLVGPKVYSSSDAFAQFCKETGFATLVGSATGGDGMGLAPRVFALPETGICIQYSTMGSLNSDGSNNEEVGTIPDALVPPGKDVFQYCLSEIYALG